MVMSNASRASSIVGPSGVALYDATM